MSLRQPGGGARSRVVLQLEGYGLRRRPVIRRIARAERWSAARSPTCQYPCRAAASGIRTQRGLALVDQLLEHLPLRDTLPGS